MKMEHAIVAPYAGRIRRVRHAAGDVVPGGEVLVELEPTGEKYSHPASRSPWNRTVGATRVSPAPAVEDICPEGNVVMPTYLDRYLAGEHERVWDELVAQGAAIREEPLYSDALAVAHETMRRVRANIEMLIPRLEALGYTFGYGWARGSSFADGSHLPVFTPPAPDVAGTIDELERRAGILPLSLRAFYEVVGSVNFVGGAPALWTDWRAVPDKLDALYVYPAVEALEGAETWQERYGHLTEEDWELPGPDEEDLCDSRAYAALPHDCWLVPIAPDEWHKYDISGCGGYEMAIPNPAADARLLTEQHRTTFVKYLRICFRWAGFPKLEQVAGAPATVSAISALTRGLLPI
jgi:hypothetical protein